VIRKRLNVYYRNYSQSYVIPVSSTVVFMHSQTPMYQVTYDDLDAHGSFAVSGVLAEEYRRLRS
jgi:hypothetical protein